MELKYLVLPSCGIEAYALCRRAFVLSLKKIGTVGGTNAKNAPTVPCGLRASELLKDV